jgi:hypothetical protein
LVIHVALSWAALKVTAVRPVAIVFVEDEEVAFSRLIGTAHRRPIVEKGQLRTRPSGKLHQVNLS